MVAWDVFTTSEQIISREIGESSVGGGGSGGGGSGGDIWDVSVGGTFSKNSRVVYLAYSVSYVNWM